MKKFKKNSILPSGCMEIPRIIHILNFVLESNNRERHFLAFIIHQNLLLDVLTFTNFANNYVKSFDNTLGESIL